MAGIGSHATRDFRREDAEAIWFRLVAGWADHLDATGARLVIEGIANDADVGGSYEGVTRMLWGIGGWLSQANRPGKVTWEGRTFDLVALSRRAILAGTDPESPGYWGHHPDGRRDQRTVESGQVAWFLWVTRERLWNRLDDAQRGRVAAWLDRVAPPQGEWLNNWALFWVLNHASRAELGLPHDRGLILDVTGAYLDRVWCGDGWYDDGPAAGANHFDDYNLWVFVSHVLLWAELDTQADPARVEILRDRVRQQMAHVPWFFGANGSYPEYGRSLAYKFARLGAPLLAWRFGLWSHDPGMLRRLVGRHLRWYLDRGAVRADGTLRQELTDGGSRAIREPYISTGATYWAMQAFAGLWTIPDDDPFWSVEEQPLPVERGDFVRVLPQPGWVLSGDRRTGAVHRFSAKSEHDPAKYGKYHASTACPITVGEDEGRLCVDGMLALDDGLHRGHRDAILSGAVGGPGWFRSRYHQQIGPVTATIDTVIVVSGNLHLRAHRVELSLDTVGIGAIEGGGALGFRRGEAIELVADRSRVISGVTTGSRGSWIRGLSGYDEAREPSIHTGVHAVDPVAAIPTLVATLAGGVSMLSCLVAMGDEIDAARLGTLEPQVTWRDDGVVIVVGMLDEPLEVAPPANDLP